MAKAPVKPSRPPVTSGAVLQVVPAGGVALLGNVPPPPPPPGTIPPPPLAPGSAAKTLALGKQPWPCVRCGTVNPYEANTCSACGQGFLDALSEPAVSLPLFGSIDALTRGSKVKIVAMVSAATLVVLLIVFTLAGLVLK